MKTSMNQTVTFEDLTHTHTQTLDTESHVFVPVGQNTAYVSNCIATFVDVAKMSYMLEVVMPTTILYPQICLYYPCFAAYNRGPL